MLTGLDPNRESPLALDGVPGERGGCWPKPSNLERVASVLAVSMFSGWRLAGFSFSFDGGGVDFCNRAGSFSSVVGERGCLLSCVHWDIKDRTTYA